MITSANAEWVLLSELYHHVVAQSPSPESAKMAISAAHKNGQLRMRGELRELKARPGLRIAPGERPPEAAPPAVTSDYAVSPDTRFCHFDWERSYAARRDAITRSLFEYVGLVVHRDDALALWPPKIEPVVSEIEEDSQADQSTEPLEIHPFGTGSAGRPTAKHFIEAEARRRIESGEVMPRQGGLSQFAEVLESWWEAQNREEHGGRGPPLSQKRIQAIVRPIWQSALNKRLRDLPS